MLRLLQWLRLHLGTMGCDAQARAAAVELIRTFDAELPAHHDDEERHVFTPLLAAGRHVQTIYRLQREHLEMAQLWPPVRAALQMLASGDWQCIAPDDEEPLERFARLFDWHLAVEEELVFPAAAERTNDER